MTCLNLFSLLFLVSVQYTPFAEIYQIAFNSFAVIQINLNFSPLSTHAKLIAISFPAS